MKIITRAILVFFALAIVIAIYGASLQKATPPATEPTVSQADVASYDAQFPIPQDGHPGEAPNSIMRIRGTFLARNGGLTIFTFTSTAVNPYQDMTKTEPGAVPDGLGNYAQPDIRYTAKIVVAGCPMNLADGDVWDGVIYPCGIKTIGLGSYHFYATSKQEALEILSRN